jgi:hypothetical protein
LLFCFLKEGACAPSFYFLNSLNKNVIEQYVMKPHIIPFRGSKYIEYSNGNGVNKK